MPVRRIRSKSARGGGVSPPSGFGFTDDFSLNILIADSNAVPTDAAIFAVALALTDSNADLTETVSLGLSGTDFSDSNAAPSETNSFTMRVWLSGSAGAGVTNPANANGQNDAANAVISTAVAGSTTETMTSNCGVSIPSGASVAAAIFRCWFTSSIPLLTSTVAIIASSSSALYADVAIINDGVARNHADGSFTFDLVAAGINTLAELQSTQFLFATQDAVAGVTPAVLNVDAGCIELAGAFV